MCSAAVDVVSVMPISYNSELRRPYYAGHKSSYLDIIPEDELEAYARLEDIDATTKKTTTHTTHMASADMTQETDEMAAAKMADLRPPTEEAHGRSSSDSMRPQMEDYLTAGGGSASGASTPGTPGLSRTSSSDNVYASFDFDKEFPSVDRLSMFDILENLALPQRLERMQNAIHDNAEKLRRQRQKLAQRALSSKNVVVDEWRKRIPKSEDQLDRYRRRMKASVERLNKRWHDNKTVSMLEKVSFVTAVLNIFISGYLIGAMPEYFHYWYTAQLL